MRCRWIVSLAVAVSLTVCAAAQSPQVVDLNTLPAMVEQYGVDYALSLRDLARYQANLDDVEEDRQNLMDNYSGAQFFMLYEQVQNKKWALEDSIEALDERLPDLLADNILKLQLQYLDYHAALLEMELALHEQDAAQNALTLAQRKLSLGMTAGSSIAPLEHALEAKMRAVSNAQKKADSSWETLAFQLSIEYEVVAGATPRLNMDDLMARDYDADLEAYLAHDQNLQARRDAVEDAEDELRSSKTRLNRHLIDAATADLARAQSEAQRSFDAQYEQLFNAIDDLKSSTIVTDAADALVKTQTRHELGLIAASAVSTAQSSCRVADLRTEQQQLQVLGQYLRYLRSVGVVYGA